MNETQGGMTAKMRIGSSKKGGAGAAGISTDRTLTQTQGMSRHGGRGYTASNWNDGVNAESTVSNEMADGEAKSITEHNRIKKSAAEARRKRAQKGSIGAASK